MPFYIYSVEHAMQRVARYTRRQSASLAGTKKGLIYKSIKDRLSEPVGAWTISQEELLRSGGIDPGAHCLASDVTPNRATDVTIMSIDHVSGWSYPEWTPLLLHLNVLIDDEFPESQAEEVRQSFDQADRETERVLTFSYLRGGHKGGSWTWGRVGQVNGPLLWADAMDFFVKEMMRIR